MNSVCVVLRYAKGFIFCKAATGGRGLWQTKPATTGRGFTKRMQW
jgi:hypothetical protein